MAEEKAGSVFTHQVIKDIKRNPTAIAGLILVAIFIFTGVFAPWLTPNDPYSQSLEHRHLPPMSQRTIELHDYSHEDPDMWHRELDVTFYLGTDHAGRCVLSRIIMGARLSLLIGVGVVAIRFAIGVPIGLLAGYARQTVDDVIMRIADGFVVFPNLLLALAIMAVRGPGIENIFFALAVAGWTGVARITRAETLSIKEKDFIMASRSVGAKTPRILFKHILPNCTAPLLVMATLGLAGPILGEAALSFLGLGAQPPQISWGRMIQQARANSPIIRGRWWQFIFPGVAIFFTVMGFNLFGDALRDIIDPRTETHGGGNN